VTEIPLFPLKTVLFPGGLLPLRVFEPRYVDMVGRCMREQSLFGVVSISQGSEVGVDVNTATVGTAARVVDFQLLSDGLLGLLCRGEQRFRIDTQHTANDGLHLASVTWLPAVSAPVPAEYAALVSVLRRVLGSLGEATRFIELRYDDIDWVSNRFAELLPLEQSMQQSLLELDDPRERLQRLAPLIDTE